MTQGTKSRALLWTLLATLGTIGCASSNEARGGTDPGDSGRDSTVAPGGAVGTASLESELYRLMVSQGAYFDENRQYTRDLESLDFTPGSGVGIDVIQADADGYSAIARSGDAECAVFSGGVRSPRGYVGLPDRPACRE